MRAFAILIAGLLLNGHAFGQSNRSSNSTAVACCSADLRWTNAGGNVEYSRSGQVPVALSLLAHVDSNCTSSEITFTATYLNENRDFICSGTIRSALALGSEVQTFNIEIRPFSALDFLRWRNQPGIRGVQQGKRLVCTNLDGTSDLGDNDRQRAAWVRLSVAVLSSNGGLAVTETMLQVNP